MIKKKKRSYVINVLDMETFEENSEVIPYCICLKLNDQLYFFYYSETIIMDVLNKIVNVSILAQIDIFIHNLNFDGILITNFLTKFVIKFDLISKQTNLYLLKIYYCGKVINFKCSYKIIPLSIQKLGELENYPKLPFPHKFVSKKTLYFKGKVPEKKYWNNEDYEKYIEINEKRLTEYDLKEEIIKYCTNDLIIIEKILKNLFKLINIEDKNIVKKSLSLPSISHKLFFKKYNILKINEKLSISNENYVRKSYFGGRCEVFGNIKNNEHIKYFDFSGMYAQCMLENFHFGESKLIEPNEVNLPGFYNIDFESNFEFLPILPSHDNNKLMFTNGKGNGTFWFEEILLFQSKGGKINRINTGLVFQNYDKVFEKFVINFNQIKNKGGYYKVFSKLIINSLYGSMALRDENNFQYMTYSEIEFNNLMKNTNVLNFYKINSCYVLIIVLDYKSKHFLQKNYFKKETNRNVSYASAISSKARIKLFIALEEVIKDGGRILYCDTDSIYAAYSKNDIRSETNLFSWLEIFEDGIFIAPKTYALKSKKEEIIKIKGISTKETTLNELKIKFFKNEKIKFLNQLNFNKNNFLLKQTYLNKEVSLFDYDKRKFIDNKLSTEPLIKNFIFE